MFLQILREKELAAAGHTIVSDLIEYGSWERDFFTVSLRRGDVRVRWYDWWLRREAKEHAKPAQMREALLLKDVDKMRNGLVSYMGKISHRTVISDNSGWFLIWRIILMLEGLETSAIDYCWLVGHRDFLVTPAATRVFESLLDESEDEDDDDDGYGADDEVSP